MNLYFDLQKWFLYFQKKVMNYRKYFKFSFIPKVNFFVEIAHLPDSSTIELVEFSVSISFNFQYTLNMKPNIFIEFNVD